MWSGVGFSVMASSTETVLFMHRIWKQGWQLYQCAELGEFDNLAPMSKVQLLSFPRDEFSQVPQSTSAY